MSQSLTSPSRRAAADDPSGAVRLAPAMVLGGVAATSAAGLVFEIALTRVFAVTQFYHFAFLAVSLALLGFGASGSALAVFPRIGLGGPRRWMWLAAAQALSTVAAYAVTNALPFDSFAIAWDRRQIGFLLVYYLALSVPFFFGGLVIAVLLSGAVGPQPVPSHQVYAASLAGSGLGAIVALGGLARLGGEGTVLLAAALAMSGATAFAVAPPKRGRSAGAAAVAIGLALLAVAVPPPLEMNLSAYKDLTGALRYPGAEIVATQWDSGTRVDLVRSEGIRSLPGLSLTYVGPVPRQDGVTFDGDDLSPIPRTAPSSADFAQHMLSGLAFQLRPNAAALVLEPRGGLDIASALANGAGSVVAVEPHGWAVAATRVGGLSVYDDPRVVTAVADPRTFVERSDAVFDVIDLALTAPYRPVTSGAYSLAEDYRLTVEAFERYLTRLAPGGILTAVRWVQTPPSEETRLLALGVAALRKGGHDVAHSVIMLRSYANAAILVNPDGFSETDVRRVRRYAEVNRFDIVTAPDATPQDANRFNVVPGEQYSELAEALLSTTDPAGIYGAHSFELAPPTDDHPFFGHFFKWSQASTVLSSLGQTWQPFGGAGYFVLLALLGISALAAAVLIAAPLLARRSERSPATAGARWWTLGYFSLLGLAFLFVEIPLIQQYILLVGRPSTAFAVTVAAILLASGVGSAWSRRVPWRTGAIALTAVAALSPLVIRWLTPWVLTMPTLMRVMLAAAMVFPVGFLMGIMFPAGLAYLERRTPHLVPWAWAINGTVSVISAAGAALLALSFGFAAVVRLGAAAYGLAALLARPRASEITRTPG